MGIVDDIVHSIGRSVRKDARHMLRPTLLALAGGLIGAAGGVFLTAWAYLTLSMMLGQASASFLLGLGLTILALGLLALARKRLSEKPPADPPLTRPRTLATGNADFASQMAFTAAFILARYLNDSKRD
jgi:FtsH-binding integral membrane protein